MHSPPSPPPPPVLTAPILTGSHRFWSENGETKFYKTQMNQMNGLAHHEIEPSILPSAEPSILHTAISSQSHEAGSESNSALLSQGCQEDLLTTRGSCWHCWEMPTPERLFHFLIRKIHLKNILEEMS